MDKLTLSLFKGFRSTQPQDVMLQEVVRLIREDESLRQLTEKHRYYRSVGLTKDASQQKYRTYCVSVATRFEGGRRAQFATERTGLGLVDIDKIPPEQLETVVQKVCSDEHTLLEYITISGQGVRIFFRYVGNDYRSAFLTACAYYSELIGLPADLQCKDLTRISGLAHDPNVFFRPDATPIEPVAQAVKRVGRPKKRHSCALQDAVHAVQKDLAKRGIAYCSGHHNEYIMQACYLLNRYGVAEEEVAEWATGEFADYGCEQVESIVRSCYAQTEEHGTLPLPKTTRRSDLATVKQIQDYLKERDIRIRHNVITRKQELYDAEKDEWTEMTDTMDNSLYCRFCTETNLRMNINDLRAVINSDFYPQFNPFRSYLMNLPQWDGVDYIDQLANYVHVSGCEQSLHNRFFKKWFVAMLPTWLEDVVNHEILTYIGRQGIYKSTFMRLLLPPELQPYFSAKNFAQRLNKDDKLELTEMGLVALEELDHMRPSEVNQLKAITSQHYMNERAVYGRHKERRPHIASFCGTGNNPQFLNDPTGNRRWLPFVVESIDSPMQHPFNYTGLYSQAYALWRDGFCYWFTDEDNAQLAEHNRQFEEPNLEEELILTYFRKPYANETGEFLTATRIIELINGYIKTPLATRNIAIAMNKMGFEKRRFRRIRGWNVVILSGEEIKNQQKLHAIESEFD